MSEELIKEAGPEDAGGLRDCGDEVCEIDWLSSRRHETDLDVVEFTRFAMEQGWGDGLPLVPPTVERVTDFITRGGGYPDEVVAILPPMRSECTVEKIAINAVMAGALPEQLPFIRAALEAIADPQFDIGGLNATTGSVVPFVVANGPVRDRLDIPYKHGCFGGAATQANAIGRTLRLLMRNVAGQKLGVTSQSVFGNPGRISGVVLAEWEERSPWAPLAERRGVSGDAVTAFGGMGTMNILDVTSHTGEEFLESIGRSLGYPGANTFSPAVAAGEVMVAINPVWAEIIGKDVPDIQDVQELIWRHTNHTLDGFQPRLAQKLEEAGRMRQDGRVYLTHTPDDVVVFVCGGTGSLHAHGVHSWGTCLSTTKALR